MMKRNKAQSISEYILVISIVSAALVAMNIYFRRGVQAVLKLSADQVSNQYDGIQDKDYKEGLSRDSSSSEDSRTTEIISQQAGGSYQTDYPAEELAQNPDDPSKEISIRTNVAQSSSSSTWQGTRNMSELERRRYEK